MLMILTFNKDPKFITSSLLFTVPAKYACATFLIATLICLSGSYLHMQLMSKFTSFYKKFQSLSQDHLTRTPQSILTTQPHTLQSFASPYIMAWLSGFLILGSGAHASIFNLRASPTSEIRHRDPIYSHLIWAFSLMFLFSGRAYWQELIESILWSHHKLKIIPHIPNQGH